MSSTEPSSGGFNSIRVLVPGTGTRFRCGGLSVALQTARLLSTLRPTEVVTYRERSDGHPYLDDVLQVEQSPGRSLWIVSWGFDVPRSLSRLRGRPVVYQAHSSGYGFTLPPGVPVVAVSRNTLGYWGDRAPRNPLFWVPNALEPQWLERGARPSSSDRNTFTERPIDVLVQKRKSSPYVLNQLVPALKAQGLRVEVQGGWVDDLVDLFNRSKVYLYDSAEYWRGQGVSEGFGLPPLEALACGCVVFGSFNHALADTLTPGVTAHQIGQGTLENDLVRISAAVASPKQWLPAASTIEELLAESSEARWCERWRVLLSQLDDLVAHGAIGLSSAHVLRSPSTRRLRWTLRWHRLRDKVANRLSG
ncbi:glycosyltransferase [Synechococcus sp. BIOS-E4-1]|uniref:glycosyltransferase n=1 Tax=Synechococcus sp. BIOS-E4-1 TaxID=1400864 RepID=UPI0016461F8D|nr:glycosyltransferase [Synechococcus sp. BIOS-E4-1]